MSPAEMESADAERLAEKQKLAKDGNYYREAVAVPYRLSGPLPKVAYAAGLCRKYGLLRGRQRCSCNPPCVPKEEDG